jgi:hypothetical protein
MKMQKATWTTDGDNFSMSMGLTKVDSERRLVHGWASLDNVDLQGDLVTAEASMKAFQKFRGNIREMHKNEAVGRMVAFKPDTYYDNEGNMYKGIYVTAYVSRGAPNTWEKVLDGTLSAFSIKGPIKSSHMDFSKADTPVRVVDDYELEELSLVDSGGNQHANLVSVEKVNGSIEVTGLVADTEIQNVFWCETDKVAKISSEDAEKCFEGHDMVVAGWTEKDSRGDVEKINSVMNDFLHKGVAAHDEGGVEVTKKDETVSAGETVPAEVDAAEQGKPETEVAASVDEVDESVEKADGVEPEAEEDTSDEANADIEKALGELEALISKGAEDNATALAELMKSIDAKFEAHSAEIETKVSELSERQNDLTKNLEGLAASLEKMVKSVNSLEGETALKKSGDLGGLQEPREDKRAGIWDGAFL